MGWLSLRWVSFSLVPLYLSLHPSHPPPTIEPLDLLSGPYLVASKIILQGEQESSPLLVPSRAGL